MNHREAWKKLGKMNKEAAMRKYLELYLSAARKITDPESKEEVKLVESALKIKAKL